MVIFRSSKSFVSEVNIIKLTEALSAHVSMGMRVFSLSFLLSSPLNEFFLISYASFLLSPLNSHIFIYTIKPLRLNCIWNPLEMNKYNLFYMPWTGLYNFHCISIFNLLFPNILHIRLLYEPNSSGIYNRMAR